MIKKLILILALLWPVVASAQGVWRKQSVNTIVNRSKADSVAIMPRDTAATNEAVSELTGLPVGDSGRIAYQFGKFWGHNAAGWLQFLTDADAGGLVPSSRNINTTSPLQGGGALNTDLTLSILNAKADASTRGAATFNANHFDDNGAGMISMDLLNGPFLSKSDTASMLGNYLRNVAYNSSYDTITLISGNSSVKLPVMNFRTKMTPLLTQPALPIQPTDSITQSLGKLQAQINAIPGTYIENQIASDQTANMRITGQIQSSGGGIKVNGNYSGGLTGAGVELAYNGSAGTFAAYNRTSAAYITARIDGNHLLLNTFSSGNVGVKQVSPSFPLDITGATRIGGTNYKLFLDRTAVATQDNVMAWRSVGTATSTDTIAWMGLGSRTDNTFFLHARQAGVNIRIPVDSTLSFSTHLDAVGTSRKIVTSMRNGKWAWNDSVLAAGRYPIDILNVQDTSISTSHKVLSAGGFIGPALPPIRTVTGSGTLLITDHTVLVNNSGAVTETLPLVSACPPGLIIVVKKISAAANNVNIQPGGSDQLDGTNSAKTLTLQYSSIGFQTNGSAWFILFSHAAATVL